MALTESKPDALAMTYARSLFDLASEQGGQDLVETCMGELEEILELARSEARFGEFLGSRVISTKKREASLRRVFEGQCEDVTLRFLLVLNEKDRLHHLAAIVGAFDQIVQEQFGRVEVDVFTAGPIATEDIHKIRDRLSSTLGKDVIVHPYTDATMIGGVRLRIGDQLVDGSVSTRLRKMRDQLHSSGAASIRARASDMLDSD